MAHRQSHHQAEAKYADSLVSCSNKLLNKLDQLGRANRSIYPIDIQPKTVDTKNISHRNNIDPQKLQKYQTNMKTFVLDKKAKTKNLIKPAVTLIERKLSL